ncbi:MAG: beta-galactosidase, partial [Phycisphaerae bacterium]|nr:beta-galactosidase [Phycisphaerae bacterium]
MLQELTGLWKLLPDPDNRGRSQAWFQSPRPEAQDAPVPGVVQQVFPDHHGVSWYWHEFRTQLKADGDHRLLLRFGAVHYLAEVWLNGAVVGGHEGGESPFALDVTDAVRTGE